ncbi:MAG: YidC/Oxa1 family membrane protein insertase, partial [Candidatus Dormibacteria bacterium]
MILFGFSNPFAPLLDPIVAGLSGLLALLTGVTHNLGWSLVLLAAIIKLALWPLNNTQFRSMQNMQRLRPKMQALQAK